MPESPLTAAVIRVLKDYEEAWNTKLQEKTERIAQLEKQISELENELLDAVKPDEVIDEALKGRLARLKSAPLDTTIREAGVILETRLREVGGEANRNLQGVGLVDTVFAPEKGLLVFSEHPGEQEGVKMLYRGAIQFVRNPPMHNLKEYQEGVARLLIRLIDSLLLLLEEGKPRTNDTVKLESVRLMLKRRPISRGQRALFQAVAEAGDKGLSYAELAKAMGISGATLSGVLGGLGVRINHTQGMSATGGIGDVLEITQDDRGGWHYKIRPVLRQALMLEKIIK